MSEKPIHRLVAALLGLAFLAIGGTAQATPIWKKYTYTGNNFTFARDLGLRDPFTTSDFISGSVFVDCGSTPSPDCSSLVSLPLTDLSPALLHYSFSAGSWGFATDPFPPPFPEFFFEFSTDSFGSITEWLFSAVGTPTFIPSGERGGVGVIGSNSAGRDRIFVHAMGESQAFNEGVPGTWTMATIPEPSALSLFLMGLLPVLLVGWRRHGSMRQKAA